MAPFEEIPYVVRLSRLFMLGWLLTPFLDVYLLGLAWWLPPGGALTVYNITQRSRRHTHPSVFPSNSSTRLYDIISHIFKPALMIKKQFEDMSDKAW